MRPPTSHRLTVPSALHLLVSECVRLVPCGHGGLAAAINTPRDPGVTSSSVIRHRTVSPGGVCLDRRVMQACTCFVVDGIPVTRETTAQDKSLVVGRDSVLGSNLNNSRL